MSFGDSLKILSTKRKQIFVGAWLGLCLGAVVYFYFPARYLVLGTVFVGRELATTAVPPATTPIPVDFTYEGFYAQQNAVGFTKTYIGVLESDENIYFAAAQLPEASLDHTAKKIKRNLRVTSPAPQLVVVKYSSFNKSEAQAIWISLVANAHQLATQLNQVGDSKVTILRLQSAPIVKEPVNNLYLNLGLGFLVGGFFSSSMYLTLAFFKSPATFKKSAKQLS